MYMMLTKKGPVFFGDTTVNENPSVDELVDITMLIDRSVKNFNIQPRIAMLSYSNFGSNIGIVPEKVRHAVKILHEQHPEILVDGEMQATFAMNPDLRSEERREGTE